MLLSPESSSNASPPASAQPFRILIVKLTSLGDVIKALPVVNDIRREIPDARIDWVVERPCDKLLALNEGIDRAIPLELRRYRKERRYAAGLRGALRDLPELRAQRYDVVIDLQGRMKSSLVATFARGPVTGPSPGPTSEPHYHRLYRRKLPRAAIADLNSVAAYRMLCALALRYAVPKTAPCYGLRPPRVVTQGLIPSKRFAVLVHGSSRPEKLWSEERWITTGRALAQQGVPCLLPWGDEAEAERAHRLAAAIGSARVPDHVVSLTDWVGIMTAATIVIGVDTGLTYLAAACGAPTASIFTTTHAAICGVHSNAPHRNLGDKGLDVTSEDVLATVDTLIAESAQPLRGRA